jgi:pilus assembly protein CpaC
LGVCTTSASVHGQPRIGDPAPSAPAAAAGAQAQPADTLPPPRKVSDLLIDHPRLEGLGTATHTGLGRTPIPTKQDREKINKFVEKFVDPQSSIDLILNRPRLWRLKEPPIRIQIPDENILSYAPVGAPTEISLIGKVVGTTVMNIWFGDRNDPAKQTVLSFLVHVLPDPEYKDRLERAYKALENEINSAFPDAYVCLYLVGDKLVVSGEVKDTIEATKILQIVRSNAPGGAAGGGRGGRGGRGRNRASDIPAETGGQFDLEAGNEPPTLEDYIVQGDTNVVNLLHIPGEQQVMLKVVVAEVSRDAARSIGIDWSITNKAGMKVFAQQTGSLLGGAAAGMVSAATGGTANAAAGNGGLVNLPILIDKGRIPIALEALRAVHLARSLAEPNLVTLNGHQANFRAGGEFPVPIVTGATATGLQGVSFVPFGVQLGFTPYIADKDRIRLQLNATVSTRDAAIGANIGTGNNTSTSVPGLNTRTINTTVEMREGQTLAIGGLLQTSLGGTTLRVPLFGDIPCFGQIFRLDTTSAGESELVLLVTPELVHPMEPKEVPPLPGSDYYEPGDLEFYLKGRLESLRNYDYRSPVMDEIHRMCAYRHCEETYFVGPHGHIQDRTTPGNEEH